ncbi:Pseudouridine synthase [Balamuthia mandrillaris]
MLARPTAAAAAAATATPHSRVWWVPLVRTTTSKARSQLLPPLPQKRLPPLSIGTASFSTLRDQDRGKPDASRRFGSRTHREEEPLPYVPKPVTVVSPRQTVKRPVAFVDEEEEEGDEGEDALGYYDYALTEVDQPTNALLEEKEEGLLMSEADMSRMQEIDAARLEMLAKKARGESVVTAEEWLREAVIKYGFAPPERIAKRIARSGLCSRRTAEKLIAEGIVTVDGLPVETPATIVDPNNVVRIAGQQLPRQPIPKVYLHYKKQGVIVTHHDPEGRVALFPHLQNMGLPRLISVGRLDFTSEGLLVLTNNASLAQYLEHPKHAWKREYRVRIRGHLTQRHVERLREGVTVAGIHYAPMKIEKTQRVPRRLEGQLERQNIWLKVVLAEGKNREIRRVFEHLRLTVTRIVRTKYGPFTMGNLQSGDTKPVPLKNFLLDKSDKYWWVW